MAANIQKNAEIAYRGHHPVHTENFQPLKLSHTQVVVRVVEVVRAVEEEERDEGLGEVGEQILAELPPSHLVHLVQLPVRRGGGVKVCEGMRVEM